MSNKKYYLIIEDKQTGRKEVDRTPMSLYEAKSEKEAMEHKGYFKVTIKEAGKKFPAPYGMRTPSNQKHKGDPRPKARPADTWDDKNVSKGARQWYRAMDRMIEKGMSEREIVQSISKKFKIDPMAIKKELRKRTASVKEATPEISVEELKGFLKNLNLRYRFEGERYHYTIKEVSLGKRKLLGSLAFIIRTKEDISVDSESYEDDWWKKTRDPLEKIIGNQLANSKYGKFFSGSVYVEDDGSIEISFDLERVNLNKSAGSDGNYMSVQNIQTILSAALFLSEMIQDGDEMEDWVEDKISDARSTLSDVARFYDSGRMMTAATSRTFLARSYKEALRKIQVQKLMGQGQFALLTAYRNEKSKSENKRLQTELRVKLAKMGYKPETLKASWDGKTEQSLLVKGIPFGKAKALGIEYGQDAIIWKGAGEAWVGMYYFNGTNAGKVEVALDTTSLTVDYDISMEKDLYSKARGISFELDFHWGKFLDTGGGTIKPKHLEKWFMAYHNMAVEVSNNEIKFI